MLTTRTTSLRAPIITARIPITPFFYPDLDLDPILVFDPSTGESDIAIYPFNTEDPLAGDAVEENALGLMMRNAQWLVQTVGVDGFRLDAAKHFETYVLEYFDRAVYRSIQEPNLDGSTRHVFSFSEVFEGDKAFPANQNPKGHQSRRAWPSGGATGMFWIFRYFSRCGTT